MKRFERGIVCLFLISTFIFMLNQAGLGRYYLIPVASAEPINYGEEGFVDPLEPNDSIAEAPTVTEQEGHLCSIQLN